MTLCMANLKESPWLLNGTSEFWITDWKLWLVGNVDMFSSKGIRYLQIRMDWQTVWFNASWADFYRIYKDNFSFSIYLDIVDVKFHKIALICLIVSSHSLRIESGRWERPVLPRNNSLCTQCHKLNDEYHLLLEWNLLQDSRKKIDP